MEEPQILSTLEPPPALLGAEARPVADTGLNAALFDVCHPGVVLRAVLLVAAGTSVAAMFGSASPVEWVGAMAILSVGSLPSVLVWLMLACGTRRLSSRWPMVLQIAWGVALGAVAGAFGCALVATALPDLSPPWVAAASAGAFGATLVVAGLVARAKALAPAHTAAQLADLQARIRPHFLFNTLNSAIALVRAEPARAEALLEDLSDLFRHALTREAGVRVALAQEIDLVQRYLAIEKVRFGERLDVQWSLDPDAAGAPVPSLLMQPLVENAVRHGVEPSVTGARVRVSTERRGSRVVIKVANTMPGGEGQPGHGMALANVRERLRLLHDVQARFEVRRQDGVFQVRIEVPAS